MRRSFFLVLCWLSIFTFSAFALEPIRTVYLYPAGASESNGYTSADEYYVTDRGAIYRTAEPRIDIYMPESAMPTDGFPTILSCPGGGYIYTSVINEGLNVAKFLVPHGYAVVVLKYRLPNGHENIPLLDAIRAMELLRDSATVWKLNADNMGVIGFSAGGHLAASLLTKFTSPKNRPDFGMLVYPVISMDSTYYHGGSCRQLLGEHPTTEQIEHWSLNKQVTAITPPCWLVACQDDPAVPVQNSILFYEALTAHKVQASMLLLPEGGHGWGFTRSFPQRELMEQAMISFLESRK